MSLRVTDLPAEVFVKALSYLLPEDLCSVSQVCHRCYQLSADDSLWRPFCGGMLKPSHQGASCKEIYMDWLRTAVDSYRKGHDITSSTEGG